MPFVDTVARMNQIQATITEMRAKTTDTTATAAAFATEVRAVSAAPATAVASAAVTSPATSTSGQAIVDAARKYEGVPYVYGGESRSGMDCSGLVQRALKDIGIDAPRLAHQQATIGTEVRSLAEAKPGDLIVTKNADHIVIYAGDGMVVHAPYAGRNVSYQKNWLTDSDIMTIRRIAPSETAKAAIPQPTSSQTTDLIASAQQNLLNGGVKSGTSASISSLLALGSGATQ